MWSKNWPITRQVVKVVHDNSDKQINDLEKRNNNKTEQYHLQNNYYRVGKKSNVEEKKNKK